MTENDNLETKLKQWKKEHREIFILEIEDKKAYLKQPNRKIIAMVTASGSDPVTVSELLLENCWLGGDEQIKTDDKYFISAMSILQDLIEVKQAVLKKI